MEESNNVNTASDIFSKVFNSSNSGLPSNIIYDVKFDGSIAKIATDGGYVEYDGINWTVFNTSNSAIPSDKVNTNL